MNKEQGTFETFDGLKLFYRYEPHGDVRDLMLILHGHGEHSGRYKKFSDHLKDLGVGCAAFDFRGTGRSEGREVYVDDLEEYLKDVSAFVRFFENKYGLPKKFILFGHSLGGLTAVHWARRNSERLRGLILSSPCLGLKLPVFLRKLNHALDRMMPRFEYRQPVYPPHLTHNTKEIEQYKQDKLIRRKITVRLLEQMLRFMNELDLKEEWPVDFPLFILAAGLEKVVDLEKAKKFYETVRSPLKDMKVFEGFYHEIFNEQEQDKAFEVLKAYLRLILQNTAEQKAS